MGKSTGDFARRLEPEPDLVAGIDLFLMSQLPDGAQHELVVRLHVPGALRPGEATHSVDDLRLERLAYR